MESLFESQAPFFSIAICTRNRRESLGITLDSLLCQKGAEERWEVFVVDNGSEDGTADFVRERAPGFPVSLRVSTEPRPGLSFARNRALSEAKGKVVLFIDDDVTCSTAWLATHQAAFADAEVVATGGRILPILPPPLPAWAHEGNFKEMCGPIGSFDHGEDELPMGRGTSIPSFFGGNMGMRRGLALSVGGFRSDLGWGSRLIPAEETDLMLRLGGCKALYLGKASVDHRLQEEKLDLNYFCKWYRGAGRASVLMKPPSNPLVWLGKVLEHCVNLIRFSPALVMNDRFVHMRTLRKFHQSTGRLAQFLGF